MTTLVLGASLNPSRFSHRAVLKLLDYGHQVIPVGIKSGKIDKIDIVTNLSDVTESIDTVSLYLNPTSLESLILNQAQAIEKLQPRRVIFNPGTESRAAMKYFESKGIEVVSACTLVMLDSGTY